MKKRLDVSRACLYPESCVLAEGEEIYGDVRFPGRAPSRWPYVIINMVASVDGRSSFAGKASGMGSETDRESMRALRSQADAVMVGAGTLRAEKLNLGLDGADVRQPIGVVVHGAGQVPISERLVRADQRLLLAVPENARVQPEAGTGDFGEGVEVLRVPGGSPDRVDLRGLLAMLKTDYNVHLLLAEGGPGLNGSLIREDLADELFVTMAPKLLSGDGTTIVAGDATDRQRDLRLVSVHSTRDELFLRYRIKAPK